jgi:hypothetical protein
VRHCLKPLPPKKEKKRKKRRTKGLEQRACLGEDRVKIHGGVGGWERQINLTVSPWEHAGQRLLYGEE